MTSSQTLAQNSVDERVNRLGFPDIALVGKAGAGKTTGAELLVSELAYRRLSFAAPLKQAACRLWGEGAATDRAKLQGLGIAVREIEPETWVNLMLGQVKTRFSEGTHPIVVDDLRFENEWYALKGAGFTIVRVRAATAQQRFDRLKANGKWQSEDQMDHPSETAVDHLEADYTIANADDRDAYYEDLVEVVIKERRRR